MSDSATRIALIYPELLGTYGDGGNAEVLAARLAWRGLPAEVVTVAAGSPVPGSCDLYLLGGGEDEPQVLAAEAIGAGALAAAVKGGAVALAVCAGFQILGRSFPGADGATNTGAGLLDVETLRTLTPGTPQPRAVGDVKATPAPPFAEVGVLTGYENHAGRTRVVPGGAGQPLARVDVGVGNGTPDRAEGWVQDVGAGVVIATYLHGPVLAQNPGLADYLLRRTGLALPQLDVEPAAELRTARLASLA